MSRVTAGTEDILLAVVAGVKGFPEAITAVFPEAIVQTCIVHLLRNSMDFVSRKERKNLASALGNLPDERRRCHRDGADDVRGRELGPALSVYAA